MGGRQRYVYHVEPARLPEDFPERLARFREAAGLSWRELARRLKTNVRTVRRWRAGTEPGSANFYALLTLAAEEGLLHILMPTVGVPEAIGLRVI